MGSILQIKSISEFHKILGLEPPYHPLISVISDEENFGREDFDNSLSNIRFASQMYTVMFKDNKSGSIAYGRNTYDYQEGTLIFAKPGHVFKTPDKNEMLGKKGWTMLFHPDLLLKSQLATKMNSFHYFSYESNEALHLSNKERTFISHIINQIKTEATQNIDTHSQKLIVYNLELFLNYAIRFYDRQFYTRSNVNLDRIAEFENILNAYFEDGLAKHKGLPSIAYFGTQLNLSPNYLSDLLKKETGKSIKEYLDHYLVARAKVLLLNSNITVSELAYKLGFDYPQSFTRLFRKKTGKSPMQFRKVS